MKIFWSVPELLVDYAHPATKEYPPDSDLPWLREHENVVRFPGKRSLFFFPLSSSPLLPFLSQFE